MAFIDEIEFHAKAGNGGGGVVRWRHEKGKEFSGPGGGNGGPGGDVYVHAVRDTNILARYKAKNFFKLGTVKLVKTSACKVEQVKIAT